jgi:hypothetical protein
MNRSRQRNRKRSPQPMARHRFPDDITIDWNEWNRWWKRCGICHFKKTVARDVCGRHTWVGSDGGAN